MVDRALRLLIRNYWSVFFVVATVTIPLQIAHATIWRNVIAVSELHADIEEFPPLRQVRGVGRGELNEALLAQWIIWAALVALIPLFIRATKRILEVDARGEVTSAADGWRAALGGSVGGRVLGALARPGLLLVGLALAALAFVLLMSCAYVLVEPLPPGPAFAWTGLALGLVLAGTGPFLLVPAAVASSAAPGRE
jgi:hypothetical protein